MSDKEIRSRSSFSDRNNITSENKIIQFKELDERSRIKLT